MGKTLFLIFGVFAPLLMFVLTNTGLAEWVSAILIYGLGAVFGPVLLIAGAIVVFGNVFIKW